MRSNRKKDFNEWKRQQEMNLRFNTIIDIFFSSPLSSIKSHSSDTPRRASCIRIFSCITHNSWIYNFILYTSSSVQAVAGARKKGFSESMNLFMCFVCKMQRLEFRVFIWEILKKRRHRKNGINIVDDVIDSNRNNSSAVTSHRMDHEIPNILTILSVSVSGSLSASANVVEAIEFYAMNKTYF